MAIDMISAVVWLILELPRGIGLAGKAAQDGRRERAGGRSMRNAAIIALVFGFSAIGVASADIPPLPGEQERYLLSVIERANHPCGKVGSYKAAGSDADGISDELDAFDVSCGNGKTYLVAVPRRRPGPPLLDPRGMPVPYPDPVVKEMSP
jgi:hypothetical protein